MSARAAAGAWGKKPSDAIRQAPPPNVVTPQKQGRGGGGGGDGGGGRQRTGGRGGGRGGGGGRHGGAGGGSSTNRRSNGGGGSNSNHPNRNPKTNLDHVKLCQEGEGTTDQQKQVRRMSADLLLSMRLDYLDAKENWSPAPEVLWEDGDSRVERIEKMHTARRRGGDVTPRPPKRVVVETAPPLEECKPLEVNEETRWKAKVFVGDTDQKEEDTDEVVLNKARLLLNKLSLTTFDKLSQELVDLGIDKCLKGVIELIVENAHVQPHFASMYASLCARLSELHVGGKKTFKKMLLTQCQIEFEKDTSQEVQDRINHIEDDQEREYQASLIKQAYLGHMRFIGELYKNDMIKIDIMLWCLKTLLEDDEEQLECFVKLMTTSGGSLELQAIALRDTANKPASYQQLQECWSTVEEFSKSFASNRIKFMLHDLLDLRANGWIERRKEETAKTLKEIHKDVAREERRASGRGGSMTRPSQSIGRRASSSGAVVDQDGFTFVPRAGSSSSLQLASSSLTQAAKGAKPNSGALRRTISAPVPKHIVSVPEAPMEPVAAAKKDFPGADVCGDKMKTILKDYFVGGDTDDAVLSVDEVVGVGHDGSVERGARMVQEGALLVMEMKESEVKKFLTVLVRCLKENKIEKESVAMGLNADPLEFLGDIEIDAPLARSHLAAIVAEVVKEKAIALDFLLESPEYFRTDGRAADFGAKVLKAMGGEIMDADVDVIEKLMTEDDKTTHGTARNLLASL